MPPKPPTTPNLGTPDLKKQLKTINHDLDHFDELVSQIEEQQQLGSLEEKMDNQQ